jgi:hypothetical protein
MAEAFTSKKVEVLRPKEVLKQFLELTLLRLQYHHEERFVFLDIAPKRQA